ncbi:MAG TPA: isopentenyl-diphosphate Delta-isomerase, partial [Longimicrobiales bacterium]|nr:isopentenyl-diphosphate Delta-isomerase [Longimicrobiales bacterium]
MNEKGEAEIPMSRVVLVDGDDRVVGVEEKWNAHLLGRLHRAFSVFVVRADGALLLQRRAPGKYHSGGLWSNAACGHPQPNEDVARAARRRLREEMGIDCALEPVSVFRYRASVGGRLSEHELDHVFVGRCEDGAVPAPDPAEVVGWRWVD